MEDAKRKRSTCKSLLTRSYATLRRLIAERTIDRNVYADLYAKMKDLFLKFSAASTILREALSEEADILLFLQQCDVVHHECCKQLAVINWIMDTLMVKEDTACSDSSASSLSESNRSAHGIVTSHLKSPKQVDAHQEKLCDDIQDSLAGTSKCSNTTLDTAMIDKSSALDDGHVSPPAPLKHEDLKPTNNYLTEQLNNGDYNIESIHMTPEIITICQPAHDVPKRTGQLQPMFDCSSQHMATSNNNSCRKVPILTQRSSYALQSPASPSPITNLHQKDVILTDCFLDHLACSTNHTNYTNDDITRTLNISKLGGVLLVLTAHYSNWDRLQHALAYITLEPAPMLDLMCTCIHYTCAY